MNARGFTLIELLIACALLLAITSAVAAMAVPLRESFERSIGAADLTGGSRMALDRLADEVREAGSGAAIGGKRLGDFLPPIVPLSDIDGTTWADPAHALRVTRVPLLAAQGILATDAPAGSFAVVLETTERCNGVGLGCGLRAGMTALLFDDSHAAAVGISSVAAGGSVRFASALPVPFAARAILVATTVTTFGLRRDSDGSFRLVRVTAGSEQPMLDHLVMFDIAVRGPDPLHPRLVDITLRVEAPSGAMRGPAGRFFTRPGTAARPSLWVPDVELTAAVALRNGVS